MSGSESISTEITKRNAVTQWRDYLELCKPRVVVVMLLTALVGMCLATPDIPAALPVVAGLLGIGLAAGSAAAINHVLDRRFDEKMIRTRNRPLPQGNLTASQAVLFAAIIGCAGIGLLAVRWKSVV